MIMTVRHREYNILNIIAAYLKEHGARPTRVPEGVLKWRKSASREMKKEDRSQDWYVGSVFVHDWFNRLNRVLS